MKRFLIMLLCLVACLCVLVACGGNEETDDSSNDSIESGASTNKGSSVQGEGSSSVGGDSSGGNSDKPDMGDDYTPDKNEIKYQYDMKEYVTLPVYNGYEVTVSLDTIQRQIDNYILNSATKSKKTVCMTGDVVKITYFGYKLDENGEILYENGKEVIFDENDNCGVYLGASLFLEEFEKGIVGMKIGDIREVYVTFPADYFEQSLAGERVMFEIILNSIYDAPIYNDELINKISPDFDSTAAFEKKLEETLILDEVYEYIFANSVILSYPEKEYNDKAKELKDLEKDFFDSYNIELDEYIEKTYGMTRDEYIKNELKSEMIFYAIAGAEGISPTDDELKTERDGLIDHYIKYYTEQGVDYREAVLKAQELVDDLGTGYIYENVIYQKIDEKLAKLASVTKEPMSYKSVTQYLSEREGAKTGNSVGDLCPSFEAEVFDEGGSLSTTVDPTKNFGKLTVINFWGTWCGPCKNELPDFDRIATEYADRVTVFAVHSSYNFDAASDYVLDNFPNSSIIFLKDYSKDPNDQYSNDVFYELLGGSNYYPHTVILDENGIIKEIHVGMLSYSELVEILASIGLEK